jgi:hypothetical protein
MMQWVNQPMRRPDVCRRNVNRPKDEAPDGGYNLKMSSYNNVGPSYDQYCKHFWSLKLRLRRNKLEYLGLANLSNRVLCLRVLRRVLEGASLRTPRHTA